MGKKDDWCSKKGIKAHQKGLKKKESAKRKFCYSMCFGISAAVFFIFGGLHSWRSDNATKINKDYPMPPIFDFGNAYDNCSTPGQIKDPEISRSDFIKLEQDVQTYCEDRQEQCKQGTQWSAAFSFNAFVLCLSAANFIVMAIGGFFFWPRYVGTWINFCYACCHCCACITGLAVAYSPIGLLCKTNVAGNNYEGDGKFNDSTTYKSDGQLLSSLSILQAIFWIVQCCLCCFPLFMTPVKDSKKDKKDKDGHHMASTGAALGTPAQQMMQMTPEQMQMQQQQQMQMQQQQQMQMQQQQQMQMQQYPQQQQQQYPQQQQQQYPQQQQQQMNGMQ